MYSLLFLCQQLVGRIALVDPAKARNIEDRIIVLAQQGQIGTVTHTVDMKPRLLMNK